MQRIETSPRHLSSRFSLQQWFWIALVVTTVLKCVMALLMPMTGEEAYNFNMTNHHFLYGYYDHPGMVVVMGYLTQLVSSGTFWLRCPQLLFTTLIACSPFLCREDLGKDKCLLTSILLLCSPMNLLFVLIVNDSYLLFFSVATMLSLVAASREGKLAWYALSGLCLGAAFFSKYLALPTAISVFLLVALDRDSGWLQKLTRYGVIFLTFLPFLVVNIVWNYYHWWDNLYMNLHSRVGDHHFHWTAALVFIGFCIALITPFSLPAVWQMLKRKLSVPPPFRIFKIAFCVHTVFFCALFLTGSRGIHWLFPWYVALVFLFAVMLSAVELTRVLKGVVTTMSVIMLVVLVGLNLPLHWFSGLKKYKDLAYYTSAPQISKLLDQYRSDYVVMAPSYSRAAVLGMGRPYVPVWGHGSHKGYAREDDIVYDFKQLDGKNIVIVNLGPSSVKKYQAYFDHVTIQPKQVGNAKVYLVLGKGFRYAHYRDTNLQYLAKRYYADKLKYLPYGQNYFLKKYFS